jgi:hypothetical protein
MRPPRLVAACSAIVDRSAEPGGDGNPTQAVALLNEQIPPRPVGKHDNTPDDR